MADSRVVGRVAARRRLVTRILGCLFVLLGAASSVVPPATAFASGWGTLKLPQPLNNQVALTDGSNLFIAGGANAGGTGAQSTVYGASASGGKLGTWQTFPALPQPLYNHAGVVQGGFAIITGGQGASNAGQATVYTAPVQSGAIGAWSATTSLPATRFDHEVVASGGYVFVLGGFGPGNATTATVYSAAQTAGTLGAWTSQAPLPQAFGEFGADVANGHVYVVGGHTGLITGSALNTVYASPIGANGTLGAWSTLTPLPQGLWDTRLVAASGYLFAIGGYTITNTGALVTTKVIYRAPLNLDGTIGAWLALTPLPANAAEHTATDVNGYLYVAGNKVSGKTSSANIYSAAVAGPWVMLSAYSTPAGSAVQVGGTGYSGGESVAILFKGMQLATATADASGSFGIPGSSSAAVSLTAPASTSPGNYTVTGKGLTSHTIGAVTLNVTAGPPPSTDLDQWPGYLNDANHTAYASAFNAFGTSNVSTITKKTSYWFNGQIVDNPAVVTISSVPSGACAGANVTIAYAGSFNTGGSTTNHPGYLYAINATTGVFCWRTFLASDTNPNPNPFCINSIGIASSPTVATVTISGVTTQVVYVGASDIMFALNAATGQIIWHTPLAGADIGTFSNAYIWSSPVYSAANNTLYASTSSFCDETSPVPGQLFTLDPAGGTIQHTWTTFADGTNGGGIWGSPTVSASQQTVYVATGNGFTPNQGCTIAEPMSCAVVALDWNTLAVKSSWQVPAAEFVADGDFGSTPVLFPGSGGGTWLAVANKNGHLYALDTANISGGPKWDIQMANGSSDPIGGIIAPTAYYPGTITTNGVSCTGVLFLATGHITINKVTNGGSISALCSLTGQILWRQFTSSYIYSAPSIANGLVTDGNGTMFEVRDWSSGTILFSFRTALIESAASFANGRIYLGTLDHKLYSFGL
ncbi:MAG: PQQ-binding-like beta-propeller repeat protein [Ktedonobacterales bacterium]